MCKYCDNLTTLGETQPQQRLHHYHLLHHLLPTPQPSGTSALPSSHRNTECHQVFRVVFVFLTPPCPQQKERQWRCGDNLVVDPLLPLPKYPFPLFFSYVTFLPLRGSSVVCVGNPPQESGLGLRCSLLSFQRDAQERGASCRCAQSCGPT